jgi:hypothetical protein
MKRRQGAPFHRQVRGERVDALEPTEFDESQMRLGLDGPELARAPWRAGIGERKDVERFRASRKQVDGPAARSHLDAEPPISFQPSGERAGQRKRNE